MDQKMLDLGGQHALLLQLQNMHPQLGRGQQMGLQMEQGASSSYVPGLDGQMSQSETGAGPNGGAPFQAVAGSNSSFSMQNQDGANQSNFAR